MGRARRIASRPVKPGLAWGRRRRRRWVRLTPWVPEDLLLSAIPSLARPVLARLTERMIDRMDEIDGDADAELDDFDIGVDDSGENEDAEGLLYDFGLYAEDQRIAIDRYHGFDVDRGIAIRP